jgi:rod shape-determining protein MreD
LFWVVKLDFPRTFLWIILSGLILDASYLAPLGLNAVAFITVAFVADYLAKRIVIAHGNRQFFILLGLIVLGTFLNDWILAGLGGMIMTGKAIYDFELFFGWNLFLKVLYNLLVFSLIYWPLRKLGNFFSFYSSRMGTIK